MTTVNVVSPTGRKTSIRIQQNTTLLAIIEEACQTNSLDGRYYKLRFHGKILDDSVTFRYSGLTNNAKVDLVLQDTPRIETDIDIALQTDQGRRLRSTHKSDESLLQILRFHAIDTPPSFVPVVQYLQEEIIGQLALENRTLRGLGLTSGKALLRVTHRVVSEKQLEEINSCVIQDRARPPEPECASKKVKVDDGVALPGPSSVRRKEVQAAAASAAGRTAPDVLFKKQANANQRTQNCHVVPSQLSNQDSAVEYQSCDRHTVVFSVEETDHFHAVQSEPGDSFYEITMRDLQSRQDQLTSEAKELAERPLLTEALRVAAAESVTDQYPFTCLRIVFPNRLALQGHFRSRETIFAVERFVRRQLADENTQFYLYTTPPKVILSDNSVLLYQANLIPKAVIYFGCKGATATDQWLKSEVQPRSIADLAAMSLESPLAPAGVEPVRDESLAAAAATGHSSDEKFESSAKKAKIVPKWFKK